MSAISSINGTQANVEPPKIPMRTASSALLAHAKGVMSVNGAYRGLKETLGYVREGLKGIDASAHTRIDAVVSTIEKRAVESVNEITGTTRAFEVADKVSGVIALINAPIWIKSYIEGSITPAINNAFHATEKTVRAYNGAKVFVYISYIAATIGWTVHSGLKIVGNEAIKLATRISPQSSSTLLRLSTVTSKVAAPIFKGFTHVYAVFSFFRPVVYGLEAYQAGKVKHIFKKLDKTEREEALKKVDSSVLKDIFGEEYEKIKGKLDGHDDKVIDQIKFYQRMKVVLTVNAIIELVSNRFLMLSATLMPVALVLLMGGALVRFGAGVWWERKVHHMKQELGLKHESTPKWLTTARLVTLVSIPLLAIQSTLPFAIAGVVIGTGTEIGYAIYKACTEAKKTKEE